MIGPSASAMTDGPVEIGGVRRVPAVGDDEQDAPRAVAPGDRHGDLGALAGQDGER